MFHSKKLAKPKVRKWNIFIDSNYGDQFMGGADRRSPPSCHCPLE